MALLLNAGDTVSRSYSYTQPSPLHPSQPQGTGERTGNLFDKSTARNGYYIDDADGREKYNAGYVGVLSASDYIDIANASNIFITDASRSRWGAYYDSSKTYVSGFNGYGSKSVPPTARYVRITVVNAKLDSIMLNYGSTPLPYEPYGYKIPISSASTTTPVYLGEVQTTRKIKKLVFNGSEPWMLSSNIVYINNTDTMKLSPLICTHFPNVQNTGMWNGNSWVFQVNITQHGMSTRDEWKAFLQQQYAAGTPVTVWYVLAKPTTGIVNEPLCKIGDYADTVSGITIPTIAGANALSVDTTLQPSEVTVNYKGWHPVQSVHEYDSNYTIATMQALTIAQLQTHTISDLQGGWS